MKRTETRLVGQPAEASRTKQLTVLFEDTAEGRGIETKCVRAHKLPGLMLSL